MDDMDKILLKEEDIIKEENDTNDELNISNENNLVSIKVDLNKDFSYVTYQCEAFYKKINNSNKQNPYSLIEKILIENKSNIDYHDLKIIFESSNPIIDISDINISSLLNNSKIGITENIYMKIKAIDVYNISEAIPSVLTIKLTNKDGIISKINYDVMIHPMDECSDIAKNYQMISCYVTPNDYFVKKLIVEASIELNKITSDPNTCFYGYQSNDIDTVLDEMKAIYNALRKEKIVYSHLLLSYESFQRIRIPNEVLTKKTGTCLDLAILYCACLESIGLNPIIIFVDGHAFAGCFLEDNHFAEKECLDAAQIYNSSAETNMIIGLVECTLFTGIDSASFEQALSSARKRLELYHGSFSAIDVTSCHASIFRPIPTKIPDENNIFKVDEKEIEIEYIESKKHKKREIYVGSKEQENKFAYWSRKLLDLSTRNKLINMYLGDANPQILIDSSTSLINKALSIPSIHLIPINKRTEKNIYYDYNTKDPSLLLNANKNIYSIVTEDSEMIRLFRKASSAIEEKGSNILFISVGMVCFIPKNSKKSFLAPVFLIPIKGKQRKDQNGFEITFMSNDVSINTTLFEYLKVECDINFDELYSLGDMNGLENVDIDSVYNAIRAKNCDNCSISVDDEKAFLATFSFDNYIIWDDIRTRKEELLKNKIISSFVSNQAFSFENEENVKTFDEDNIPSDIAIPLGADSSQIEAILDCDRGESFVLDGPPGTGKSQTIVNMIVNSMYHNKKILFVAEKKAALSVVKERLDKINLGNFCLELHSNNSNKKDFLDQIDKALQYSHIKSPNELTNNSNELLKQRYTLNLLIEKIHKKVYLEPLYDCIVKYTELKDLGFNKINFLDNDEKLYQKFTDETRKDIDDILEKFKAITVKHGEYALNPFYSFDIKDFNFMEKNSLLELLNIHFDKTNDFVIEMKKIEELLPEDLRFSKLDEVTIKKIITIFNYLLKGNIIIKNILSKQMENTNNKNQMVINLGLENDRIYKEVCEYYNDNIFDYNVKESISKIENCTNKIKLFFVKNKIIKEIKKFIPLEKIKSKEINLNRNNILTILNKIKKYQDNNDYIYQNNDFLKNLFDNNYSDNNESNNIHKYEEYVNNHQFNLISLIYQNTYSLREEIISLDLSSDQKIELIQTLISLYRDINNDILRYRLETLIETRKEFQESQNSLINKYEFNPKKLKDCNSTTYYQSYVETFNKMISNIDKIDIIALSNRLLEQLVNENVPQFIINNYTKGIITIDDFKKHLDCYLYYNLINDYFNDKYFSEFNGSLFDNAIKKYNDLLDKYTQLVIIETASRVTENYPLKDFDYAKSTKIAGLLKCIKNNGHKTTIRRILNEYDTYIRTICPCFLMSPQSAAQYLDVQSEKFDIVIFDEASQIPTCEAIGAISRGNSLIVAGDPEQMPPTTFFKKNITNENIVEISDNIEDLESLLDDCLSLNMPRNRLLWHYRSQHESLIAFSNNTFYNHLLYTFPSPDDTSSKVSYHYIDNGVYDFGINLNEAKAVFEEVKRRFNDPVLCKQSIGIVTFNIKQQDILLDLINDYFDKNPDIAQINRENEDELFVKDLENVQGHERDVIIFSIGFGYDKNHKFSLLFGPLSSERGERRLNVAVTRARKEMLIFASIHSSDINAEKTKNDGPRILKNFLAYAEYGKKTLIVEGNHQTNVEPGIEKFIQKDLLDKGYNSDINIGDSKFKINLCVKGNDGKYILGVICDGKTYIDVPTCRDRNNVQIQMLDRLKWKVIHIYTIDYYKNRDLVINTIIDAIKSSDNSLDTIKHENKLNQIEFEKDEVKLFVNGKEYVKYSPKKVCDYESLSEEKYNRYIIKELEKAIDSEGPISENLLLERFKQMINITKMGTRVRRIFDLNMKYVYHREKFIEDKTSFYLPLNQTMDNVNYYRQSSYDIRHISDIPSCEIRWAIIDLLDAHGTLKIEELSNLLCGIFGVKNVVQTINEAISKKVYYILSTYNDFTIYNGFIKKK